MTIPDRPYNPTDAMQPSDESLVAAACQGDAAAFDQLVDRYQQRAVSVSMRLLGNVHDALEVVQEAFIRAYRNLDTLQNHARFRSWLLRIVTNLSLNHRRDRAPSQQVARLDETNESLGNLRRTVDAPGAAMNLAETQQRLSEAVANLPDHQRTALVLFCLEQLPQKEVAAIMGCSVEAVKWHVFQARKTLRTRLRDLLQDET